MRRNAGRRLCDLESRSEPKATHYEHDCRKDRRDDEPNTRQHDLWLAAWRRFAQIPTRVTRHRTNTESAGRLAETGVTFRLQPQGQSRSYARCSGMRIASP